MEKILSVSYTTDRTLSLSSTPAKERYSQRFYSCNLPKTVYRVTKITSQENKHGRTMV